MNLQQRSEPVEVSSGSLKDPSDRNDDIMDEEEGNAPDLQSAELTVLKTLTQRENKAVNYSRLAVFLILVISMVSFSFSAYRVTRAEQKNNFETSFKSYASDLIDIFHRSIDTQVLEAVDALSIAMTSYALGTNQSFPFVTLPNYHVLAANVRVSSGIMNVAYASIVSNDQYEDWNEFALTHRSQYIDSIVAERAQIDVQDAMFGEDERRAVSGIQHDITEDDLPGVIIDLDLTTGSSRPAEPGTGPYLVNWQQSPAVPFAGGFNFNLLSHPAGKYAFKECIRTGEAVLDRADSLVKDEYGETGTYLKLILSMSQYRDTIDEYVDDPASALAYPVFDSFDTLNRKVVGLITGSIYWRLYFSDILPSTARGVVCVMSNNFNQTFTYQVDGKTAIYLGNGDRHDPKYNYLAQSITVSDLVADISSKRTKSYTSAELSKSFAKYSLTVYPSDATMEPFVNNEPVINMFVIVGVVFFVSVVFFAYDVFVGRHTRKLTARAVASGAIVSSLFPSRTRDMLYEEEYEAKKKKRAMELSVMHGGDDTSLHASIAEYFDSTTIMFADLAGFTKWSSTRTPKEVFHLLETLYQAFDDIAVRLKVFKVETIGDCYVAAAGLPEPQEKHAVIMVKFANECMNKMRELLGSLGASLGEDTAELDFRVGLHSGPVTGGVLRGQKSRFQLFGPTMNQASRIESTGVPGRIHVSQDTATELRKHGKDSWLQTRQDKVVAKGLGEIETFWAVVAPNAASSEAPTLNH